jgi:glutamate dehydrogenase/leucine dehydrogenase
VRRENGTLMMDIKVLIHSGKQEQIISISGSGTVSYIDYSFDRKEGDALKAASFAADLKSTSGLKGQYLDEHDKQESGG